MRTQMEKAELFRALHARPGAFIIPNPWDAGTAKLLAAMGFEALATTSLGFALTLGGTTVSRDAIIENCRMISAATDLPVNADLENCGADDPKLAAEAIGLAAEAGAVGGSIEDSTGDPRQPIYDFALAVERVQAAVEAARALPFPFTLTAQSRKPAARPQRSRRHHPPAAGVRSRRRRRAVFARRARPRHHQDGGVGAEKTVQSGDGLCRPDADASTNCPKPASSASASAARCRALRSRPSCNAPAR